MSVKTYIGSQNFLTLLDFDLMVILLDNILGVTDPFKTILDFTDNLEALALLLYQIRPYITERDLGQKS